MTFKNNGMYDHMRICLAYLSEQNEPVAITKLMYVCNNAKVGYPKAVRTLLESGLVKKIPGTYKHGSYVITPKGHRALGLFNQQASMIERNG